MGSFSYTSRAVDFYAGSFSYTSRAGFSLFSFLFFFPFFKFYWGRFSYTSRAGFFFFFFFIWGVSLTHPVLASFLSEEFLLHIHVLALVLLADFLLHIRPCWLQFYLGSFSYTSDRAGFNFIWGVSLTHPALASFSLRGVSLTHPMLTLFFMWGVSLTHPVLPSFLCREFLLHITYWLVLFYLGSFSYTSRAGFFLLFFFYFIFLSGEFLLQIPVLALFFI